MKNNLLLVVLFFIGCHQDSKEVIILPEKQEVINSYSYMIETSLAEAQLLTLFQKPTKVKILSTGKLGKKNRFLIELQGTSIQRLLENYEQEGKLQFDFVFPSPEEMLDEWHVFSFTKEMSIEELKYFCEIHRIFLMGFENIYPKSSTNSPQQIFWYKVRLLYFEERNLEFFKNEKEIKSLNDFDTRMQ